MRYLIKTSPSESLALDQESKGTGLHPDYFLGRLKKNELWKEMIQDSLDDEAAVLDDCLHVNHLGSGLWLVQITFNGLYLVQRA